MANARHILWLYEELPALVREGLLSEEQAAALRARYGKVESVSRASIIIVLFSVLAAALIASGIILLLASNWDQLGRGTRAALSFAPLAIGQALAAFTLWQRRDSVAWREGSGILLAGAIGASIALIGQTYNVPGDPQAFLLTWIVLGMPLVYLLNATTVALAGMAATVSWALGQRWQSEETAYFFWAYLLFVLPHVYMAWRSDRAGARFQLLGWGLCLMLLFLPVALPYRHSGLWLLVYSALGSAGVLLGVSPWAGRWWNAFLFIGGGGTALLSLIFSFSGFWTSGILDKSELISVSGEWLMALPLLALPGALLLIRRAERDPLVMLWAALPLLTYPTYVLAAAQFSPGIITFVYNLFAFALGVATLVTGARRGSLGQANIGMALVSMLAILRFFDSDFGFLLRGVVFILVGAGFLVVNLYLSRRNKRAEAAA
ncbi:MAG: DUF2157 domain-containing protein [Candidatus Hydrogenedens sp.]|nr:DUF2157 domain-containing protein [Candidatus Hydrogenedens sp.]